MKIRSPLPNAAASLGKPAPQPQGGFRMAFGSVLEGISANSLQGLGTANGAKAGVAAQVPGTAEALIEESEIVAGQSEAGAEGFSAAVVDTSTVLQFARAETVAATHTPAAHAVHAASPSSGEVRPRNGSERGTEVGKLSRADYPAHNANSENATPPYGAITAAQPVAVVAAHGSAPVKPSNEAPLSQQGNATADATLVLGHPTGPPMRAAAANLTGEVSIARLPAEEKLPPSRIAGNVPAPTEGVSATLPGPLKGKPSSAMRRMSSHGGLNAVVAPSLRVAPSPVSSVAGAGMHTQPELGGPPAAPSMPAAITTAPAAGITPATRSGSLAHPATADVLLRMDSAAPGGVVQLRAEPRHLEVGVSAGALGWVEIRTTAASAGHVDANIHVRSEAAASAFTEQAKDLTNFAREHSVEIGRLSVGVGTGERAPDQENSEGAPDAGKPEVHQALAAASNEADEDGQPMSLISVRA